MNYLQAIKKLLKFFSTTDQQQFVEIFGEHMGNHLWRKYHSSIENKQSVFKQNITLDEVHKFLCNLDIENEQLFNRYMNTHFNNLIPIEA